MRNFKFRINGNEYTADIKSVKDDVITVDINGISYDVEIEKKEKKTPVLAVPKIIHSSIETNKKTAKPGETDLRIVKAPIPSTVLQIKSKVGENIELGDTIMILEAMKMQNEVHATSSGKIKEVFVKEGDSVMEGDNLISIEK